MRTFLLIYLLVIALGSTISQNLNFAEHVGVDKTSQVVSINSKSYYISRSSYNCDNSELYLNVANSSGASILKKLISSFGINNFGRFIQTKDNALLLSWGQSYSTDAGPTKEFLVKLDTNGNFLFQTQVNFYPDQFDPEPLVKEITQHNDSSYDLLTYSDLLHFSSSGSYLSTISTPGILGRRNITRLQNGTLFIHGSTNSSPYVNFIINKGGTVLKQNSCQFPLEKIKESSQYYFGLNVGGILEKYDTSLVFQGNSSSALSPGSYTITDFALRNDSIFTTGISGTLKNPFYAILNSNLNVLYQTNSNLQGATPTGISLPANNAVHIVSTCYSASKKEYTFSSLHKLNLNGVFYASSNIGVIGFSDYNTRLIKTNGTLCTPFLELNVTVKNFGLDTVKSFYLNSHAQWGSISNCLILLHKYHEINIAPGGTLTISTGTFYSQPFYSDTIKNVSKNVNICVFTSIPNQSNDTDINNDGYCATILMTTTGIEKNEVPGANFKLFPNPFKESFTIQSNEEISSYALYTALGEKIGEEKLHTKEFQFQAENLSPGIYFIRIESSNGLLVKKLIKND